MSGQGPNITQTENVDHRKSPKEDPHLSIAFDIDASIAAAASFQALQGFRFFLLLQTRTETFLRVIKDRRLIDDAVPLKQSPAVIIKKVIKDLL